MSEIKPCPFCGSNKTKIDSQQSKFYGRSDGKYYKYSIRCNVCHARGPITSSYINLYDSMADGIEYTTKAELELRVIEAWNNRYE